jgi:CubicO group peptidase (beta-lactamase class C family)
MANAPGITFNYNSGNSQLLSAIIARLTGMDARDYARAKLFTPLGIRTANWLRDPQLNAIGGSGLSMLPRDMAKIGYLYLRNGEWNGKQLLPTAWIDKASHATMDMKLSGNPNLRYSNSFWHLPDKKVYMAVGSQCQLIMVFPELDIVAVTTARDFCPFGRLTDDISGAVKSETPLPPHPEAANRLSTAIRLVSAGRAQSR